VTVNISAAIQAHPARALMAQALAAEVGAEVVLDPDPDNPIRSPWRTLRHVLETTPQEATHRLVLQDDTSPCPGFRDAAQAAIEARSDRLILFFVAGRPESHARAVWDACERDEPWAELPPAHFLAQVSVAWPVSLIEPMLTFIDQQNWRDDFSADDERVCRWVRHAGIVPVSTVPNLCQHPDTSLSLIGRRTMAGADPGRVSCCYIENCDPAMDAREIDWNRVTPALDGGREFLPQISRAEQR
jgi:hypothetical protein